MHRQADVIEIEDDIDPEVILKEAKARCKKIEIDWTSSMITKCQLFINKHKEALTSYLIERDILKEEKAYFRGSTFNGEESSSDNEDISLQLNKEGVNDIDKMGLFSDTYEIVKASNPDWFYRSIITHMSHNTNCTEMHYKNQTFIPNDLKFSTGSREMILYRFDRVGEYHLSKIIGRPVTMSLDLHIASGKGELLSLRGEEPSTQYNITALTSPMSYFILEPQTVLTQFTLLVSTPPMAIAIEIQQAGDTPIVPDPLPIPEGYPPTPATITKRNYPSSFIRRILPPADIQRKILFLDVCTAVDIHDYPVPLAVTVLDYGGSVLLSTLICPRTKVKDFCQTVHGLTEKGAVGQADSTETLWHLQNIVWDKIVVGHDLRPKIRALGIDVRSLCGIRDLRGSAALNDWLGREKAAWDPSSISAVMLQQPVVANKRHSAEVNAHATRNIYLALEPYWTDSVSPPSPPPPTKSTEEVCPVPWINVSTYTSVDSGRLSPDDFFGTKRRRL